MSIWVVFFHLGSYCFIKLYILVYCGVQYTMLSSGAMITLILRCNFVVGDITGLVYEVIKLFIFMDVSGQNILMKISSVTLYISI